MIRTTILQIQGWACVLRQPCLAETLAWNLSEVGLRQTLACLQQDASGFAYEIATGRR